MTGFLNASLFSQFGVVSVDWSNSKALWVEPPMSCEERLVEQAALLKAARPGVRVMGYRNIVRSSHIAPRTPAAQPNLLPSSPLEGQGLTVVPIGSREDGRPGDAFNAHHAARPLRPQLRP